MSPEGYLLDFAETALERARRLGCDPTPLPQGLHPPPLLAFRVQASGFGVRGSGVRVQGSGSTVQGAGCRVQGAGYRVQSSQLGGVLSAGFRTPEHL